MKPSRFYRATIAIAMMLIGWLPLYATEFSVDGINYKITSSTDFTVEVTEKYSNYSGAIVIPPTVTYNDVTYSVTGIDEYAFYRCFNLTEVEIPTSVTIIEKWAFAQCVDLASIKIPNGVKYIEDYAFRECSNLSNIELPNTLISIGSLAFYSCGDLKNIICLATNPPSIQSNSFSSTSSSKELYVPEECKSVYQKADNWGNFKIIELGSCNRKLYIEDFAIYTDEIIDLAINMDNDLFFTGFVADLYLPNGLELIPCNEDLYFELTNRKGNNHIILVEKLPNNAIRLSCNSETLSVFEGTNGSLINFKVRASEDFVGDFEIILKGIVFTHKGFIDFEINPSTTKVQGKMLAQNISIEPSNVCIEATQSTFLSAIILPENTSDKSTNWNSSDESVAIVDNNGMVTAIAVGEAIITATTIDGSNLNASCKVTVVPTLAESIILDKDDVTIIVPNSETLVATILPELATDKSVVWTSSDESVAIVNEEGVITAVSSGQVVVTATTIDGSNLSATCNVNIIQLAESITLDKEDVKLEVTETTSLTAKILPETTSYKNIVWSSSNESVAVVDEHGVVTAVALGEVVITVATLDGTELSATCRVEVVPTLAESITLDLVELTLEATETKALSMTILPELTTDKTVTWESSDENVALVSAEGIVTAISVGEATITVSTADSSNLSATCMVTVIPTLAESITLDAAELTLEATERATLSATILPELTTDKSIAWMSSDENVATVDEYGVVTAIAVGETIITATTGDGSNLSATCKVIIVPTLAEYIFIDTTLISLKSTETIKLEATIYPSLTTNKSVVWKTSNQSIATVEMDGVVTAIAVGEAIITASTTDGSNLSATCMVTVVPTLAESITIDVAELTLEATETATLSATILPELTTDKSVEWSSSDESVAVVDDNGVVTAISVGEAIITATTGDGSNLSATCKVIVKPTLATSITLDYSEYEIVEKSDFQLVATVLPDLTTCKDVVWSSSDMWVASVDANGLVRAYSVGEAIITASTTDGSNLSASCKVTVLTSLAESIALDLTEISLRATETATLVSTVLPETTSNKGVEWSSSDESIATVSNKGIVTAIAVGEAIITATTVDGTDLSATCKVMVVPTLAESVVLNLNEVSLEATETATLEATVFPELATDKSVEWSSSDESVAIVDENGMVTAISLGEAIITATAIDGSGVSATCQVTIVPTLAMSIELDKTEYNVEEKSDFQLVVTILPEHTTNKEIAWSSSDKWVASVDNNGFVTVYAVGEATITATTTDGTNLSATCSINVYSGIDGVNGYDVIVATIGDNIVVKNAKLGSVVNVYASNGELIASKEATDGSVVVEAPMKGVYVVKVGKQIVKMII